MTLAVVADEPDNRILEAAQEAGSEYIVTEDRALLRIKKHAGAKLVTAAQFLAEAVGKGPAQERS
jgi:predicted nucleic acid-binding protein